MDKTYICQVPENVARFVKRELALYPAYREALIEMEQDYQDLIHRSRQFSETPGSGNLVDIVGRTVERMQEIELRVAEKRGMIRKIDKGLAILDEEEQRLIKARFFSTAGFSNEQVMLQLGYTNRNRYYGVLNRAIYKFAIVFGLA
jgi:ArpU family phage transcriptional regulator